MGNASEYQVLEAEYRRIYAEYEAAALEMLVLAEDPASSVSEFRRMSDHVSYLADQLGNLRMALTLRYGSSAGLVSESEPEPFRNPSITSPQPPATD
jgi:hypothetical protein